MIRRSLIRTMDQIKCECSICLEPFETPRGLPCLHNFCTKCLQWHIDNSRVGESFNCPICRGVTTPSDTSMPSSTWATTFPIANVVCELMEMLRITREENKSSEDECGLCLTQNVHSNSISLCKTCELNLCQSCSETHSMRSPGHKILMDKDSFVMSQQEEKDYVCPTHKNSTLDLFCIKCDLFICLKCTFGRHASCSKDGMVKTIGILVEEKKTDDQIQKTKLENGRDEMNKLITDTERAKETLFISKLNNQAKIDAIVDAMILSLERKREDGKARLEKVFNTRSECLEKTSVFAQKRRTGLTQSISKLQTNLEIENNYEYLSKSKETITHTVNKVLPTCFNTKSDISFSVDPDFRLIFNQMEPIDIGNAFLALDTDHEETPWCKFETAQKLIVKVYSADIITTKVDGIVNPTDSKLTHSRELSEQITLAADTVISENKKVFRARGGVDQLEMSDVYITRAGNLDFKFIIHAVVPDHEQIFYNRKRNLQDLEDLIAKTVSNSLFVANSLKLQSVALPSFCFSPGFAEIYPRGYLRGVEEFSKRYCADSTNTLREVHFVNTSLLVTHQIQTKFKKYLKIIYILD